MTTKTYTKEVELILGGSRLSKLESASLRLHKFTTVGEVSNKGQLEAVATIARGNALAFKATGFSDLPNSGNFTMKLMGRMMVNQAEGLFENAGLKLHRFFGYPIIPGSALKGIARHAAWWQWSEKQSDELAIEIASIFGFPTNDASLDKKLEELGVKEQQGAVSFIDATPKTQDWKIAVDILTPHGGCDTKNPIPVTFPTIEKGAIFSFTLVSKDELLRGKAVKWLKIALEEDGVGSKTAAGYGWFKEVNNAS